MAAAPPSISFHSAWVLLRYMLDGCPGICEATGSDDPVGEYGRGVHRAVEEYRAAGIERVEEIIYPAARHEILNEPIADKVQTDILSRLERRGL